MTSPVLVSIVVPVFNDEKTIAKALESCLVQTLADIEIICIDDASTDRTASIIEQYRDRDARVRLIRNRTNQSALQARRRGVLAATADHVLFLDGDDELSPRAAAETVRLARASGADIVGFGVVVIGQDGATGGAYERDLQPRSRRLDGADVLRRLFPIGEPAQGQLWRYLFRTEVVRDAYAMLPDDLVLERVNDLPIMFLVALLTKRYAATKKRLYRYHLGRGGSGHRVDSVERARFYASAIRSIASISPAVTSLAAGREDRAQIVESYESAREWIIAYVCHQVTTRSDPKVTSAALEEVYAHASPSAVFLATARYFPQTLTTLAGLLPWKGLEPGSPCSVMIAVSRLAPGENSLVLDQSRALKAMGYRVTIAVLRPGSDRRLVPEGVTFRELTGDTAYSRLSEWAEFCRSQAVDVVIDHQAAADLEWPSRALIARAEDTATIGWARISVDGRFPGDAEHLTLLMHCIPVLALLIVSSELDVSYFKLRGVRHVAHAVAPPASGADPRSEPLVPLSDFVEGVIPPTSSPEPTPAEIIRFREAQIARGEQREMTVPFDRPGGIPHGTARSQVEKLARAALTAAPAFRPLARRVRSWLRHR